MIVRRFVTWAKTVPATRRAQGASALARALVSGSLPPGAEGEAAAALTALLDDPSPLVRRGLAEALADHPLAPCHVIAALAADHPDISASVLARSPLLSDTQLIDCAAMGEASAQQAIAGRVRLSAPVAAALAEVAAVEALITLALNAGADLPEFSMHRMIERHGRNSALREALLARKDLPPAIRHHLVVATAEALADFVSARAWLPKDRAYRIAAETGERAVVTISDGADPGSCRSLVRYLRHSAALTPGLILRAILSQNIAFCEAALAELSGLSPARIAGLLREPAGLGFAAVYRRAGLPPALLPVYRVALAAAVEIGRAPAPDGSPSRQVVGRVLAAFGENAGGSYPLAALLLDVDAEIIRNEARRAVDDLLLVEDSTDARHCEPIRGDPIQALQHWEGLAEEGAMPAAA
jgi:uncharacterized protein (DUF2336 family)